MPEIFDAGCFCGHWPYRKLRSNTLPHLTALHQRAGISSGLVSSLSSIFYNDPLEGDLELANAIAGTPYQLACNLNPALQGCNIAAKRAITQLSPAALRLYPTIHKYSLDLPVLDTLAHQAADANIPIILTARLEDPRLDFMLEQSVPDLNAFLAYAEKNPATRFLLSGFYPYELQQIPLPFPENVWVDLAGCFKPVFALEEILKTVPSERILYASFAPLKAVHSTLLSLTECSLASDTLSRITSQNYIEFLGR